MLQYTTELVANGLTHPCLATVHVSMHNVRNTYLFRNGVIVLAADMLEVLYFEHITGAGVSAAFD